MAKLLNTFGSPAFPLGMAALLITSTSSVFAAEISDDSALEEIIITAQKRNERLQDVPVAASVVGTDLLARASAANISDLNKLVPSVQLKGTINGRVPMGMRGVSTNANTNAVGLTSGVAIQIDGVPVPPDSFAANSLDDLVQVEVLKGPQATLGGRTASAGMINYVTGSPSDVFKAKASATVTDDGERRANFSVAAPINEMFSFSFAGFGSRVLYPIENTLDNNKHTQTEDYGARGKLKFKPSDDFDATLMAHYWHFRSEGNNFVHQYLTPGVNILPFLGGGIPQSVLFPGINIHYGNTQVSSINKGATGPFAVWKDTDGSLVLNYRMGGTTVSSITAYQSEKQNARQDAFYTAVYVFPGIPAAPPFFAGLPGYDNSNNPTQDVKQFSQEVKIASDASLPFSYLAGLFYSDNKVIASLERPFILNAENNTTLSRTKTAAAYARLTSKITASTSLTGGLRLNNDRLTFQKTQYFNPANNQYQGCGPLDPQGLPVPAPPTCVLPTNRDNSSTLVGDISLQQKFAADSMMYGSYTRGYKPKAFNTAETFNKATPTQSVDTLTLAAVDKEKIDSFEVGLKAGIAGWGNLNIAVFHTTYNNYQAQVFPFVAGRIGVLKLTNSGKARSQGVEADFTARFAEKTRVSVAAAYIDAKFLRFQNAPCYGDQTPATGCVNGVQDLSGVRMPDSPRFKANLDVEHRIELGATTELVLAGNYSYRTDARFQANNNPRAEQPAFGLLNLNAGVDLKGGQYNVTLFVNNVTNHFYLTNAENFYSGLFGPGANNVIGQPARDSERYFGVRVSAKF